MNQARCLRMAVAAMLVLAPALASAQANLVPFIPTGWNWPITPRPAADGTAASVPLPTTLTGNSAATWMNVSARNIGTTTAGTFHSETHLDGDVVVNGRNWISLTPGASSSANNGGPFTIPGGRHTLELRLDSTEVVAESNETDNNTARQWVWSPLEVPAGTRIARAAPPDPTGGWSSIPAGQDKYNNCDGLRLTAGSGWDVLYTQVDDLSADYDCLVYTPSTGASSGFTTSFAASRRRGAGLDGAIISGHRAPGQSVDVGVERHAGTATYHVEHVASHPLVSGDSITITLGQDEMLRVFDVGLAGGVGPIVVTAQLATTAPSLQALWFDYTSFVSGSLTDFTASAASDGNGTLRLYADVPAPGSYGLVLMRDPDWGTGPRDLTLTVRHAYPDLVANTPAGWHSPLVPRMSMDGTPTAVALPDTLIPYNSSAGAVLNWSFRNNSPAAMPSTTNADFLVDGVSCGSLQVPALAAWGACAENGTWRREYKAGRHTLVARADGNNAVREALEGNNTWGEQYCWGPFLTLQTGDMGWWFTSGTNYAGAGDITSGETFWPNSVGARMPAPASNVWWAAVATAPYTDSDLDVSVHETLHGVKDGFAAPLAGSYLGGNAIDYVLVNYNLTTKRMLDVGIQNYVGTTGGVVQYAPSTTIMQTGDQTLPTYSPGANDFVQLWEFYLTPACYVIHVINQSPASLGLTLHNPTPVYQGRTSGISAQPKGPGIDTWLNTKVTTAGWYCIAVWRSDCFGGIGNGSYRLNIHSGASATPDQPTIPAATGIVGIHPNPFNPQTRIAFDLASNATVRLAVYDLQGALVRTLVSAALSAGSHEATWDGRDNDGRALASGTYLARLEADGMQQTQKLVLMK